MNAAQLLKHTLGLATWKRSRQSPRFTLYYIFYDAVGPESQAHRQEIARFAAQVGADLDFRWVTYQDVFARLARDHAGGNAAYIDYLAGRYFTSS